MPAIGDWRSMCRRPAGRREQQARCLTLSSGRASAIEQGVKRIALGCSGIRRMPKLNANKNTGHSLKRQIVELEAAGLELEALVISHRLGRAGTGQPRRPCSL